MTKGKGVRWWPVLLIFILTTARLLWIWLGTSNNRQAQVMPTLYALVLAFLALLLWLFLFSRLPGKTRLFLFVGFVGLASLVTATVEIRGVSGDVLPILSWRWSGPGDLANPQRVADAPTTSSPTDFPQFLGPRRDATVQGLQLARDWGNHPPEEVWRRPVGDAWSSFAIVGNALLTQEQRDGQQAVTRYDLETGEPVWVTPYPGFFESVVGGNGPRATPTVAGGKVYAFGVTGVLVCLDLKDGRILWQVDTLEAFSATTPEWGLSGSPLLVDDLVVVSVGGHSGNSLVAFRQDNGESVWKGGSDGAGYASPLLAEVAGKRQIIVFNKASFAGHDPSDGRVLWSHPWPGNQPNVAQPMIIDGDKILVSSGYGIGAGLYQLTADDNGGFTLTELWTSIRLKSKFANMVQHGGYIYGLDDGILTCVNPADGQRLWKRGRYGHGQLLLVGDLLLVQTEKGDLVLLEPNPEEHRELGSFRALDGKSWNNPALSGPYLVVRNANEAACYKLPLA